MSEINDGGSAFPLPVTISPAGDEHIAYQGMTLRDYFAANAPTPHEPMPLEEHVAYRYRYADAMIAERAK